MSHPYRCRCKGCGQQIQRNGAWLNGTAWHWAELRDSGLLSQATHICRECNSFLTRENVDRTMMPDGSVWRTCGVCGGQNLKWLGLEGGKQRIEVLM